MKLLLNIRIALIDIKAILIFYCNLITVLKTEKIYKMYLHLLTMFRKIYSFVWNRFFNYTTITSSFFFWYTIILFWNRLLNSNTIIRNFFLWSKIIMIWSGFLDNRGITSRFFLWRKVLRNTFCIFCIGDRAAKETLN